MNQRRSNLKWLAGILMFVALYAVGYWVFVLAFS
ncbi:hypothetical protein JOD17_003563 [Geomicrobium sediminis]|uniref:Uncharacterized protein n=1 Tax=Geomicrobium sediminis TaxID=1347788 RepID=A0ABS2PGQ5_9BACL|nr:hypothetical protein [Geomicrobium sediminis]